MAVSDVTARAADDRTLVVVPTFNEALNVAEIVERLLRVDPAVDVLVVDDSSPTGRRSSSSAWPKSTRAYACSAAPRSPAAATP